MMLLHFDLVDLRLMVNVADANSMTKGAERSHISLAAASMRIKNLESSVGVQLLNRSGKGVTLTPPGQAIVHSARAVQSQLDQLRGELQGYARGIKGRLRIFANTTAVCEYLPAVLSSYLPGHPDVNVDLREKLSNDIVRGVMEGRADIGVVADAVRTEDLEVLPYREDRMVVVMPRGHPLSQRKSLDFLETLDYEHVGLQEASALNFFLLRASNDLHRQINLRVQAGSFEAACRMVESSVGISIVPEVVALRHVRSMAIVMVPLSDPWASRSMKICIRKLTELPKFARDLVDMLLEDAQSARR